MVMVVVVEEVVGPVFEGEGVLVGVDEKGGGV